MASYDTRPDSRVDRRPSRAVYNIRRAAALGAIGLAAFGVKATVGAFESGQVEGSLQQPFAAVQAQVRAGDFAPDSVDEITLPAGSYAGDVAAEVANKFGNNSQGALYDIQNDMSAQIGNTPLAGEHVFLPAGDVPNAPKADLNK